jgi:hypothetical protein
LYWRGVESVVASEFIPVGSYKPGDLITGRVEKMARLSAPKRSSHSKNAAASFVRRHEIVCDTCRDQRAGANQESLPIVTATPWAWRSRTAASVPYQVASARSALGAAFLRCGPCMLPRPSVSKETIKLALRGRDASASQPFLSKTSCATCALFRGREWR